MTSFYANAVLVLLLMICSEVHSLIDCFSPCVFRFNKIICQAWFLILRGFKKEELRFSEKILKK
jgi:hypothetical protein